MTKNEWREHFKKRRALVSVSEREEKSILIANRLFSLPLYERAESVFIFIGMDNEIDTRYIIEQALHDGKIVAAPRVLNKRDGMAFFPINTSSRFIRSKFGVLEPDGEIAAVPNEKTIIITPGLAFDSKLYRVGYGGGFYDCYLQNACYMASIGISYDFQFVPELPTNYYDIPVSILITEMNIYRR